MTGNAQAAERAGRRLLLLALCGGVLVVAVFLACLLLVAADTPLAPPQPDTLMYMQYARAAAEGHPYRFTADQGPSTGSTSHLYPFLLAALYRAGARGDALFAAGFALNAVFYLLVIWLAWLLARRLAPGAEAVALGLVLLSGPLACGALGGSDMGLFMVLALATLTALVYARPRTAAACIALAVWARPEGFIMASVLLAAGLWRMLRRRGHPTLAAIGLWACAHMAAVLWLNHALTGRLVFLSLAGKGYRALHPFPWFLAHVMRDYASVALGLLLGLGRDGRAYYMVPVVGGVAGLVGLGRWWCPAEGRFAAAWWWISVLGAFGLVAMGGWQGYLHDRHLAWVLAPWIVCVAAGVGAPPVPPAVRRLLVALLVGYQAVTFPYFVRSFARMAERTAGQAAFARRVAARLPAGARVGVLNYPGLAYVMPGRTLVHLGGYVSPPFVTDGDFVTNIETLKHRPETRFEAWLLAGYEGRHPAVRRLAGPVIEREAPASSDGSLSLVFQEADWSTLDVPFEPLDPAVRAEVSGLRLVDSLDVGWLRDEAAHGYVVSAFDSDLRVEPGMATRSLAGCVLSDVGRVVSGGEAFRVDATPGREMRMVLRTADAIRANAYRRGGILPYHSFRLKEAPRVTVGVDGREAGSFTLPQTGDGVFAEVVLAVPAEYVTSARPLVVVSGAHVSFAWWFYQ